MAGGAAALGSLEGKDFKGRAGSNGLTEGAAALHSSESRDWMIGLDQGFGRRGGCLGVFIR